jgi:hypothetical protein
MFKFTGLRILVYLRGISRELARANELAETRLALEYPQWAKTEKVKSAIRSPKFSHISAPSIELWNKAYKERQMRDGIETEEE